MKKIVQEVEVKIDVETQVLDGLNKQLELLNENAEDNAEAIVDLTDKIGKYKKGISSAGNKTKESTNKMSKGFGNFLKSLGIITLVIKAFETLKEALGRNQKAADFMATSGLVLEMVLDKVVQNGVIPLAEWLSEAFTKPQVLIDDLKVKLESVKLKFKEFGSFIGSQFVESWLTLQKSILNARIQWNEFTGDSEEANLLIQKVKDINIEIDALDKSQGEYVDKAKAGWVAIKKGITDGVNGLVEFGKETLKAADAQVALNNAAKIAEALRAKTQLELQRQSELQRQIRDDTTKSFEERKAASTELANILDRQEEKELAYAQASLNRAIAEESRNKGNTDLIIAKIAAETALVEVQERIASQRSEQQISELGTNQEIIDSTLAKIDSETELTNALVDENVKRLENEIEAADAKLAFLVESGQAETEQFAQLQQARELLEINRVQAVEVAEKKSQEEIAKARQATINQGLSAASNFVGALQSLNQAVLSNQLAGAKGNFEEEEKIRKEGFKRSKALQITNAVISTAQAVIAAYSSAAAVPIAGIALGPIMAAAAGAAGAIQIAAISAQKYTPSGGGSTTVSQPARPALPSFGNSLSPNIEFLGNSNNLNTVGGGVEDPTEPPTVNATVSITEIESVGGTVSEYENGSLLEGGG